MGSLVAAIQVEASAMGAEQVRKGDRDVEEATFVIGLAETDREAA